MSRNRRKNVTTGMVKLPKILPTDWMRTKRGWMNTGEGGQAFFMLGFQPKSECCVDMFCLVEPTNVEPTSVLPIEKYRQNRDTDHIRYGYKDTDTGEFHELFNPLLGTTCIFIGSTGLSLFDHSGEGKYFCPSIRHLTEEGRALYNLMKTLHREVRLISVLDT